MGGRLEDNKAVALAEPIPALQDPVSPFVISAGKGQFAYMKCFSDVTEFCNFR